MDKKAKKKQLLEFKKRRKILEDYNDQVYFNQRDENKKWKSAHLKVFMDCE